MLTTIKKIDQLSLSKKLPFFTSAVRAGFPSPADDYRSPDLDLYRHLVKHPSATYFLRVEGESMQEFGIFNQDLLIVDRSLDAQPGDIVIAAVDGELTCKQLVKKNEFYYLQAGHPDYPILALQNTEVALWGVVIWAIHSTYPARSVK